MPSVYIILQKNIPGVNAHGQEGHALSKHSDELDTLAKRTGVKPIMSFFSVKKDEALGLVDGEDIGVRIPDERWFAAEDGLKTISALIKAVGNQPDAKSLALVKELAYFQSVLEEARSHNVPWHLGIDY